MDHEHPVTTSPRTPARPAHWPQWLHAETTVDYLAVAAFLLAFLLFYFRTVFLSHERVMQFFISVPYFKPIGLDLHQMLGYSEALVLKHQSPYIGNNLYPPLASVLFAPLLWLQAGTAYLLISALNVACFVYLTLVFPRTVVAGSRLRGADAVLLVAGLYSYGFQFEIERGQFNLIAMACACLGLSLFYRHPRRRLAACALLTLAIQLKVYPAIFALLLIDRDEPWTRGARRLAGLALANFALLFVLGGGVFRDFLGAMARQINAPNRVISNHSIRAFSDNIAALHPALSASGVAGALFAVCGICLALVMLQFFRKARPGFDSLCFGALALGTFLIPNVSHDYKLAYLPAVAATVVAGLRPGATAASARGLGHLLLLFLVLFLVSAASFSFVYRGSHYLVMNSLGVLVALLLALAAMAWLDRPGRNNAPPF